MKNQQPEESIFDEQGYRFNVAIIIVNDRGQAFWGKRRGQDSWQFPQGGVNAGESAEQAMLRELHEETGLKQEHIEILAETSSWLKYRLPVRYRRRRRPGMVQCVGQKQKWYLLRLRTGDDDVDLAACSKPEFDDWRWVNYWMPAKEVVHFKRKVYQQALEELAENVPGLTEMPLKVTVPASTQRSGKQRKAPSFAKRTRSR